MFAAQTAHEFAQGFEADARVEREVRLLVLLEERPQAARDRHRVGRVVAEQDRDEIFESSVAGGVAGEALLE
jgi:hypothetical protein